MIQPSCLFFSNPYPKKEPLKLMGHPIENHQSRVDVSRSLFDWVEDTKLVWKLTLQLWPLVHPSALWQKFLFGMAGNHHKHEWTKGCLDWWLLAIKPPIEAPIMWFLFGMGGTSQPSEVWVLCWWVWLWAFTTRWTPSLWWFSRWCQDLLQLGWLEKPHSWEKDLEKRMQQGERRWFSRRIPSQDFESHWLKKSIRDAISGIIWYYNKNFCHIGLAPTNYWPQPGGSTSCWGDHVSGDLFWIQGRWTNVRKAMEGTWRDMAVDVDKLTSRK